MNTGFEQFLTLPETERKAVFQSAAARLGAPPEYMEKDFWVCFVLEALYNRLPEGHPEIFFKGGTSLSKAFGLINRFSEDVDVVISPEGLGFGADRDPTLEQSGLKNKARAKLFEELQTACGDYMRGRLAPMLQFALGKDCAVIPDAADTGGQSLLVQYPALYPGQGADYVRPQVKIEGGARSALEPHTTAAAGPYIAGELQGHISLAAGNLRVITPEYTYLDKILILHGLYCGHRDEGRIPQEGNRISRHYYDAAVMTKTETGRRALADKELLASVQEHSIRTFYRKWQKIEDAVPGAVRLVPQPKLCEALKKDYKAMQGMILGDAPNFEWIIEQIRAAEEEINRRT